MADIPPLPPGFTLDQPAGNDPYSRNRAYAKPAPAGGYLTKLSPQDEVGFQQWVKQNNVPFDPSPQADYDMRGFYKGLKAGDPHASTGTNANDGKLHFSDYWKTPYHKSFSAESQWATQDAPRWNEKDQLVLPTGQVVFDERARAAAQQPNEIPPLPPGFTLDQPGKPQAALEPRPQAFGAATPYVSAAVRPVINAVTSIPALAADTGVAAVNLGKMLGRGELPKLADFNPFAKTGGSQMDYELPSRSFNAALEQTFPAPQSLGGRLAEAGSSIILGSQIPSPQAAQQAPGFLMPRTSVADPGLPTRQASPVARELTVKENTFQRGRDVGYVAPPSTVKQGPVQSLAESLGGKAATQQAASSKNQQVTNELIRQELGIPEGAPITREVLGGIRNKAGRVYAEVAQSGAIKPDQQYIDEVSALAKASEDIAKDFPDANVAAGDEISKLVKSLDRPGFDAKSALAYMRELRKQGTANLTAARIAGGDPAKQALGSAQRDAAGALEDLVIRHLQEQGKGDLAQSFDAARTLIAKTHSVESALNPSTGNIIAHQLATQLKKGRPLSGNLRTVADFAGAFPKATEELRNSGPVSALDALVAAGGGFGINPGFFLWPGARWAARQSLLSSPVQNALLAQRSVPNELARTPYVMGSLPAYQALLPSDK